MSHLMIETEKGPGPLANYNSLTDGHLTGYFANARKRRHLRKVGLISRSGHLVSENTYRINTARKEHRKHIKNLLAQAIVEKTLDLERHRQNIIKQKLEEIAKMELVQRVREEEKERPVKKWSSRPNSAVPTSTQKVNLLPRAQSASEKRPNEEDILPFLSPRSPRRPISGPAATKSVGSPKGKYRPISAPQRKRPESGSTKTSTNYDDEDEEDVEYLDISPRRNGENRNDNGVDIKQLYSLNAAALRKYAMTLAKIEQGRGGMSPYNITTQVPLPPKSPRREHNTSARSRRYKEGGVSDRSPTRRAAGGQAYSHQMESITVHPGQLQSMVEVTMRYHGWKLSLARDELDPRNQVIIEQQHCGGNTLTVFKEKLLPKSDFTFVSHRHRGYPFSLTIYVDGRMDSRVSTCCEYRHAKHVRLGGPNGHFSIVSVTGNMPCYKCQVQRGRKKKKKKQTSAKPEDGTEEIILEAHQTPETEVQNQNSGDEGNQEQILVPVENDVVEVKPIEEAYGNYDDDFEDSDAEKDKKDEKKRRSVKNKFKKKKVRISEKLDYKFKNPSSAERGMDEIKRVEVDSDDSLGAGPTYTFLKNNERSDIKEEEADPVSQAREITITDDKRWIITVKGPDKDNSPQTSKQDSASNKTQEVILNKDSKSLICLKSDGKDDTSSPKKRIPRIKSAKIQRSQKSKDHSSSSSTSSTDSISVKKSTIETRKRSEDINEDPNTENGRETAMGSRDEYESSFESEESGTESTVKSSSVKSSNSSQSASQPKPEKRDSKEENIEDEILSAQELLKELENDINTADEVSDIETEAESPRRQDPSKRKVTFSEEISLKRYEVPEETESIVEISVEPSNKNVKLVSKDIYRSRENLSISDSEDDSQHGYRKSQLSHNSTEKTPDSVNSNNNNSDRFLESESKTQNHTIDTLEDITSKTSENAVNFAVSKESNHIEKMNDNEDKTRQGSEVTELNMKTIPPAINVIFDEDDTPRMENSNSDLRGDDCEAVDSPKVADSNPSECVADQEMVDSNIADTTTEKKMDTETDSTKESLPESVGTEEEAKTVDSQIVEIPKKKVNVRSESEKEDSKTVDSQIVEIPKEKVNIVSENEKQKEEDKQVDDEIDDFLKTCMDEAKDLVGNQPRLIAEEDHQPPEHTNSGTSDTDSDSSSDSQGSSGDTDHIRDNYSKKLKQKKFKEKSDLNIVNEIRENKSSLKSNSPRKLQKNRSVSFDLDVDNKHSNELSNEGQSGQGRSITRKNKKSNPNYMDSDTGKLVVEINSKSDDTDSYSSDSLSSSDDESSSSSSSEDDPLLSNRTPDDQVIDSQLTNYS